MLTNRQIYFNFKFDKTKRRKITKSSYLYNFGWADNAFAINKMI